MPASTTEDDIFFNLVCKILRHVPILWPVRNCELSSGYFFDPITAILYFSIILPARFYGICEDRDINRVFYLSINNLKIIKTISITNSYVHVHLSVLS